MTDRPRSGRCSRHSQRSTVHRFLHRCHPRQSILASLFFVLHDFQMRSPRNTRMAVTNPLPTIAVVMSRSPHRRSLRVVASGHPSKGTHACQKPIPCFSILPEHFLRPAPVLATQFKPLCNDSCRYIRQAPVFRTDASSWGGRSPSRRSQPGAKRGRKFVVS